MESFAKRPVWTCQILLQKTIRANQTKYGAAMVIESFTDGSTCNLGFRIDPPEKLQSTLKKIQNLHTLFSKSPIFGLRELRADQASYCTLFPT